MNLFVKCRSCGRPVRIASDATTRKVMPLFFTLPCSYPDCPSQGLMQYYNRQSVYAVAGNGAGPVVGGLAAAAALGAIVAGPLGALIAGLLGGSAGAAAASSAEESARGFNES